MHSYTNDQVLTDVFHKDIRRARSATHSMIPTKTGAAAAIGLVIPELAGKLDGFSIRVPTINVSMVDLSFIAARDTSVDEIHKLMKAASEGELKGILNYNNQPLVSVDYQSRSGFQHLRRDPHQGHRPAGEGMRLVRQRMGLLNRMLDTTIAFWNANKQVTTSPSIMPVSLCVANVRIPVSCLVASRLHMDMEAAMNVLKMTDLDLKDKRVLIREDLNVPVDERQDHQRRAHPCLAAHYPVRLKAGARVMLVSHLGRPKEGEYDPELSLAPVAERLTALLGVKVPLLKDWISGVDVEPGSAVLCENVRFLKGEKKGRGGTGQEHGRPLRYLCHGCLRHRAPRRSIHPWRRQIRPHRLRRTAAGKRTGSPGPCSGESGAAAGGHRRGLQGLHQALGAGRAI